MSVARNANCWLCGRHPGRLIEYHHPVPKSRGGRETVPIRPIRHRTLHRTFSNAELALLGGSLATLKADPRIGRFLAWIVNKDPAPTLAPVNQRLYVAARQEGLS